MLRSLNGLRGINIAATDDDIGFVRDFLFDDRFWHVRYVVVDTGSWLPGRKVLISPAALGPILPSASLFGSDRLRVNLTRAQIQNSPPVETDCPVSRQKEAVLSDYFTWPAYWSSLRPVNQAARAVAQTLAEAERAAEAERDPNLRSVKEVAGYHLEATDGAIGHIEDFIVDDDIWVIRYFVVDTINWLPGRKVLAWPQLIASVSWHARRVHVDLDRETIKSSPEYASGQPVARDYEIQLYEHYGRQGYWLEPTSSGTA